MKETSKMVHISEEASVSFVSVVFLNQGYASCAQRVRKLGGFAFFWNCIAGSFKLFSSFLYFYTEVKHDKQTTPSIYISVNLYSV